MPNAVKIRKVKENIEIGDENSNDKGVSPHLINHVFGNKMILQTQPAASSAMPTMA